MREIEVVDASYEFIQKLTPDELPKIITSHIASLEELEKKTDQAQKKAEIAKEKVNESKYSKTLRWFGDSEANFNTLQKAQLEIVIATTEISDALKISYENQEALANISKYLFAIGCTTIAANRSVVRGLEAELSGASPEKLGALARSELHGVIRQLKAQEDVLEKLDRLKENQSTLHEELEQIAKKNNEANAEQRTALTKQTRQLEKLSTSISEKIASDIQILRKEFEQEFKTIRSITFETQSETENINNELQRHLEDINKIHSELTKQQGDLNARDMYLSRSLDDAIKEFSVYKNSVNFRFKKIYIGIGIFISALLVMAITIAVK